MQDSSGTNRIPVEGTAASFYFPCVSVWCLELCWGSLLQAGVCSSSSLLHPISKAKGRGSVVEPQAHIYNINQKNQVVLKMWLVCFPDQVSYNLCLDNTSSARCYLFRCVTQGSLSEQTAPMLLR